MAAVTPEQAVRNYLIGLKDPRSLLDRDQITRLKEKLEASDDELERLRIRQQLADEEAPRLDRYEEDFIAHAKEWADANQVGPQAFTEEGVPATILRRAGFSMAGRGGRGRRGAARRSPRSRVTTEEIRAAIPRGQFTIQQLQERSGASLASVRKVIREEESAGRLTRVGTDRSHAGPGRAPTLYKRAR